MENPPISGSEQKIDEYVTRIQNGESKDSIFDGLPESFRSSVDKKLAESAEKKETPQGPPVNYIEVVIDDEFMQKNLVQNGGLRMRGGEANWNGEVDLMKYVLSENLSPEYRKIAEDKIEKFKAGQEKTYQHESHHIRNRENGLTPHMAAENLREFLTFRVLDELSAFATGELYNKDLTSEHILTALQKAKQAIENSYYGEPFSNDAKWYTSQHSNNPEASSRQINPEKYHRIIRQYFKINGKDTLNILGESGKMPEFTEIVNGLILKLDNVMNTENLNT